MRYIIPAVLILFSCGEPEERDQKESKGFCLKEPFKSEVEFVSVKKEQVVEGIPLTGSIEANPDRVIRFVSPVSGVVTHAFFSLGDIVREGQVLLQISSPELSALQAKLVASEAQIESQKLHLEATELMFTDGVASQRDLVDARNALRISKAEKQKIKSVLDRYRKSDTENEFQIIAPASGVITAKGVNAGMSIADTGESLFSIADLNDVWVMVNVYATSIQHISEGMSVDIRTISYPGEVFQGKIKALSHVLDENSNVLKARVVIENPGHRLKPGMIADVIAHKPRDTEAMALPLSAVVFADNRNYVLVYKADCDIQARAIDIVAENEDTVYLSSGLEENEQIIINNQLLIFEAIRF